MRPKITSSDFENESRAGKPRQPYASLSITYHRVVTKFKQRNVTLTISNESLADTTTRKRPVINSTSKRVVPRLVSLAASLETFLLRPTTSGGC
ncbi:hypothetical protein EVAR_11898_1 [Eumeta japonica]|uniref:Uncharacterized protein n=1 Tax=Eumeta variegata TaxID=151549 RepID=A0A4C1U7M2_EUMVA|nr:hypothetical protein EVAR_11898_1 [Eumeta japonica]